uniref:Sacsin-like n=1 Tax=Saccoglossus kowalevskii TaxID=10224 RepID=A0ABM0MQF6_SACKO|nr:PREDICTED: sacsin-like [Saccoglossus kowalevskii]
MTTVSTHVTCVRKITTERFILDAAMMLFAPNNITNGFYICFNRNAVNILTPSGMIPDDDFGQEVPPLYLYLKRILDKYPEGGQILKEIIQNADDAGATEVKFLYDNTEYPTDGLWSDKLKEFHGPALYAYNNAVFKDKDWFSIQRPEQSGKADDPLKVGRFGLGFNSVYHITDLPSVLSGKCLGIFDPLETVFAYDQYKNKKYQNKAGKKWKLKGELLSKAHTPYSNQFEPYLGVFGCDESSFYKGRFDGTIFRFPLRKTESKLSGNIISRDRIIGPDGWITSFRKDVDLTLLFLKNIESISVYECSGQNAESTLLYSASIAQSVIDRVRIQKSEFLEQVKSTKQADAVTIDIEIKFEDQFKEEVKRWVVAHQIPGSVLSEELRCLADDEEIRLLPWVGAAMQISNNTSEYQNGGRIFCFLPLPPSQTTGLPVHIHGYFGLGDNRRSIKWPDMESQQDKTARWNHLLTSEAIPEVYMKLITALMHEYKLEPRYVYAAWPNPCKVTTNNWKLLLEKLLQKLMRNSVFYTEANSGTWVCLKKAIFNIPQENVLPDIIHMMLAHGQPIVTLPMHSLEWLKSSNISLNKLTPVIVRNFLKSTPHQNMDRRNKLNLLEYILSDANYIELDGLHLLPLANGTFTSFSRVYGARKIFIATTNCPQYLLPNMDHRFLDESLPDTLTSKLQYACCHTQLNVLNADTVIQNLGSALPTNWTKGTGSTVIWSQVASAQYPPCQWLSQFWIWFERQHNIPLSHLHGFPLVPLKNRGYSIELLKLIPGPKAIFIGTLSEDVGKVVTSCGGFVLNDELPYLPKSLNQYIASANANGVITVLENLGIDTVEQKLKNSPVLARSLSKLFSQLDRHACDEHRSILIRLPIFESILDGKYVSLKQCCLIAPYEYKKIPCNKVKKILLANTDYNIVHLASVLGAKKLEFIDFLEDYILSEIENGYYSDLEVLQIVGWVLSRSQYDEIVKKYRCVKTRGGQLLKPCEIIDPDNSLLKVLLGEPSQLVDSHFKLIKQLRRVGFMEESNISHDVIYHIAKHLDCQRHKCTAVTMQKAHCLLKYVNRFPAKLSKIITLAWIPCDVNRPKGYPMFIPWFGDDINNSQHLFTPTEVTIHDNCKLIGGVMPIIPIKYQNDSLHSTIQWQILDGKTNSEHVEKVVKQMMLIVDSTNEISIDMHKSLEDIIFEIYCFLAKSKIQWVKHWVRNNGGNTPKWIWHGSGFTSADNVAFTSNLQINLQPYLFTLPPILAAQFSKFFKEMNIPQEFNSRVLIDVLHKIKNKHCENVSPNDVESDLKLSCEILQLLCKGDILKEDIQKLILVPAKMYDKSKLQLVEVNICLYRDREFISDDLKDNSFYIVHDDIPNATARKLGLQPLSKHVAPTGNLGYDLAGPHESVINAIKSNLEVYKEGVDIFKELIQNADDAGATDIRFLIDQRQNTDVQLKLLDPGMKHCHGPALWSYNDAMFSSEDIRNICDIAAATKKNKLDKIGRFGLGFTSVYHVTDVPSVVSGSHVMIFDPRMTHLKSRIHNPSQPGIRLNLEEESHRRTLGVCIDQFQPYHGIFGCNISEDFNYNGTLFRLPLRTCHQASDPENLITDKVYQDKQKLQQLIVQLRNSAPSLLLFTQSVKEMSIWELKTGSRTGADAVKMLTIKVNLIQQLPREIPTLSRCQPRKRINLLKCQSNILHATSAWMQSRNGNPPETTSLIEVLFESQLSKSMTKKKQKETWLISSCASGGPAFKEAQTDDGRKQGFLPCGGVAAKLTAGVNRLNPLPLEGQLYSFLPVTVRTGLPIHLNAPFALQTNRRHIWSKSSDSGRNREFESEWNLCLMRDVLLKALINLLTDMTQLQKKGVVGRYVFHTLWPIMDSTETDFHPFVRAFYEHVTRSQDINIIYNDSKWVGLHDCLFLGKDLQKESKIVESATILLNEYCKPRRVVLLNKDIENSIRGTQLVNQENVYNIYRFYNDIFFRHTEDINQDISKTLLLYLLDIRIGSQKNVSFDGILKTTPCFPVSPDGNSIDVPHNLVHPKSLVGKLFDDSDGRFPYGDAFLSKERLLSLTDLGMATEELSWEDICGRAESVMDVFHTRGFNAAVSRTKIIFKVMSNLMKSGKEPTLNEQHRLSKTTFLPVLKKPSDYPCDWMGEEKLSDGSNMYGKKCMDYIGSVANIFDECRIDSADLTQKITEILGVKSHVNVDDVLLQLRQVSKFPKSRNTMKMCFNIYQYLQTVLCKEVTTESGDTLVRISTGYEDQVEELRSMNAFYVDEAFVGAGQLAFKWTDISSPYLYKIPRDLVKCRKLLQVCGVRESFNIDDFLDVLKQLKEKNRDDPLDKHGLRLVLLMLSKLGSLECNLKTCDIYAPDTNHYLRDVKDLTYDDAPWLTNKTQFIYAHHDITLKQADRLGIDGAKKKKSNEFSSPLEYTEDFGQKEDLTDRLKDILKAYPGGFEIFKELLQNADDAMATELHIIYDPRSHPTGKIVSDLWKPIQESPAICVFNDRVFSAGDIEGIQQVGIGGKSADGYTTGQYGIGFNSVYHLTDCPSFLSDDELLGVFDPQLRYVEGASQQSPGILYRPIVKLKEHFEDMVSGFLGDHFTLKGGTMFRFPLRQEVSQISHKIYTDEYIRHLLLQFKRHACDCLLFLNNVTTITVSEILRTGELKQLYKAEAKMSDEDKLNRSKIVSQLSDYKKTHVADIPLMSVNYNLHICDSKERNEKWLLVQQLGFCSPPEMQLVGEELGKLLPRVGVAALVENNKRMAKKDDSYSHLTNATRIHDDSKKKSFSAYCFLPLPIETNLPVHVNGHFALDRARRYLWNDANVNQSIRSDWNQSLIEKALAPAYANLIEIAGQRYIKYTHAGSPNENRLKWYHELFPVYTPELKCKATTASFRISPWRFLAAKTLQFIAAKALPVLPVIRETGDGVDGHGDSDGGNGIGYQLTWHEPVNEDDQVYFDSLPYTTEGSDTRAFLRKTGFNLTASTMKIFYSFINASVDVEQVNTDAVIRFMHSDKCKNQIGSLPCRLEESAFIELSKFKNILSYILSGLNHPNDLNGLPLLLFEDSTIGVFNQHTPPFLSSFTELLPTLNKMFIARGVLPMLKKFQIDKINNLPTAIWNKFTSQDLAKFVHTQLPSNWYDANQNVDFNSRPELLRWLKLLWCYLSSRDDSNVLEPINKWPIIPTTKNTLVTPSQGKNVLNLSMHQDMVGLQWKVVTFMRKVGCAEVKLSLMTETFDSTNAERVHVLLKPYVTSLGQYKDVLSLFETMMNLDLITFHDISIEEASLMLQYFQEEVMRYDENSIFTLKKLPFYENYCRELTSLHEYQHCHFLVDHIPEFEQDTWTLHCSCVFLTKHHHLQLLLQTLGVTDITSFEVYTKYILPNFNIMSEKARLLHLEYMRDNMYRLSGSESVRKHLLMALSQIKFIRAVNGKMEKADYFFDGSNELFRLMEDKKRILPAPFSDYIWKTFLKDLGLNIEVTPDIFLRYANEVASKAVGQRSCHMKEMIHISKMLAAELKSNDSLHIRSFLREVSAIKFIPSAKVPSELLNIHPAFSETTFICLSGHFSVDHMKLSWSTSLMLPSWAIPSKIRNHASTQIKLWESLGILEEPSLDTVINHCQNVCNLIAKKNSPEKQDPLSSVRGLLSQVLIDMYDVFKQNKDRTSLKERLCNTPIVLVDSNKVLVRGNQLAYKFDGLQDDELQPYMYTPPRALGSYETLLKCIGAEEKATFRQYANVLSTIHYNSSGGHLTPNERVKAKKATKGLFYYMTEHKQSEYGVSEIYLPSMTGRVSLSTNLFYGDTTILPRIQSKRYEFVVPLSECECHEDIKIDLLPENLRPKNIGKTVLEKKDPQSEVCLAGESCQFEQHFQKILTSVEFADCVHRVVCHQQGTMKSNEIGGMLKGVTVRCMKTFRTKLFNPTCDEFIERSETTEAAFLDEKQIVYITHGDLPGDNVFLSRISHIVNRLTGYQMKDCVQVLILLSYSIEQFHDILTNTFKIPELNAATKALRRDTHAPGNTVPFDIHHLLDHSLFNTFKKNEIVALMRCTTSSADHSETCEYFFAKIIEVADGTGLSMRYKVNSGAGEYEIVSVNDLYKFLRPESQPAHEIMMHPSPTDDVPVSPLIDVSLKEAIDQIKKTLQEAFKLPKEERDKILHSSFY